MHFCEKCPYFGGSFPALMKHYRWVHSKEPGFRIRCGIQGCYRSYSSLRAYSNHRRSKHRQFGEDDEEAFPHGFEHHGANGGEDLDDINAPDAEHAEIENLANQNQEIIAYQNNENEIQQPLDMTARLATVLLSLREKHKLPGTSISAALEDLGALVVDVYADTKREILEILHNNDGQEDRMEQKIITALNPQSKITDVFEYFTDQRRFNRYIEQKMAFVGPEEYLLSHATRRCKRKTYQYVSILDTLKLLIAHNDVFAEVMNGHQTADGKLGDYCDGSHFKNHPLFSTERSILIFLYFDDFTVVNQIGNHTKEFKISAFYFVIGNLEPRYRTKLDSIYLALLCKTKYCKEFGLKKVLMPLILRPWKLMVLM